MASKNTVTLTHFSVTRVDCMCSNCLTTTLPVGCVCCSWSSLNGSPYPGATVCILNVSCNIVKKKTANQNVYFSLECNKDTTNYEYVIWESSYNENRHFFSLFVIIC